MDKVIGTAIVAALIIGALVLMGLSWQRRARRDIALGYAAASTTGGSATRFLTVSCWYVATTPTSNPLERLAIPGLAFRAKADVSIEPAGILIEPAGEHPTLIDATRLVAVRAADATIDRSAGRGGLTALDWIAANGTEISTFLRITSKLDRQVFTDAATQMTLNFAPQPAPHPATKDVNK